MTTMQPLIEHIHDWRAENLAVDFDRRLVTNIILSGGVSRNGHRYTEEALRQATPLYLGRPVFLDHAANPARPFERSTRDLVGAVLEPRFEDGRIRGDIQVLDTEAGRTFLALIDANQPTVGMSHVVLAERGGDPHTVERIHEVVSVDAVAFPATTQRFRESESAEENSWETLVEQFHAVTAERDALREQLLARQRDENQRTRMECIEDELRAAALPAFVDTPAFREQLAGIDDAECRRRILAERVELARRCKPQPPASQPRASHATAGDHEFLRAVRGDRPHVLCGW